jgi:hypothetical protein
LYLHQRLRPLRQLRPLRLLLKRLTQQHPTQHPIHRRTHNHKHRPNNRHLQLHLPRAANQANPIRHKPLLWIARTQIKAPPLQVISSNTLNNTIRFEHSTEPIQLHGRTNSKDSLRSGLTIVNLCTPVAGLELLVKILQLVQETIPFRTW